jgi:hypothetical protein
LALVLATFALPALAQLDRPRFAEVLAAARTYADERAFIFYCLRTGGRADTRRRRRQRAMGSPA